MSHAKYKLSRAEQETIIRWDATTNNATVYTATPWVIRALDEKVASHPDSFKCVWVDEIFEAKRYEMDKKLIRFKLPATPAQAQAAKLNLSRFTSRRADTSTGFEDTDEKK